MSLDCSGNLIESLDLSGLPALERLDCWDNLIESLDVSACPSLWQLYCQGNRIADLTALREWLAQDGRLGAVEPQLAGEGEIEI
ncbi:leucine-rich repeat domain-containing protein [Collinsella sp. An271]|uniref:leucine-rich repeat domain-containing protein n=1 Tax=Collinsella sp. An271 TaxID=1965616 RepID=UPI0013026DBA|nr:leucine-rich repeat domain-containing protein [Collinsella sp. An271]